MITEEILNTCLQSYNKYLANNSCIRDDIIVIVNMNRPSYEKRLYIYNLKTKTIEREHHVSHGIGSSDPNNPARAITFSNTPSSRRTSLGAMYTGEVYKGKYGKSLKLYGLEKGKNDNVARRTIVIHPAPYVSDAYIRKYGYCGRSFGCFALDGAVSSGLIDLIKDGVFLYCYYQGEQL
jgi:hypothetical protein